MNVHGRRGSDRLEDIMKDFHKEAHIKFNVERLVTARVGDLEVEEIGGVPFEVREIEGSEKVVDVSRRKTVNM